MAESPNPSDRIQRDIDTIRSTAREITKDFFTWQPLNKLFFDHYNHLTNVTLHEMLTRSTFNYETTTKVGTVTFRNLFLLPPFKGGISPNNLPGIHAGERHSPEEMLTAATSMPSETWFLASDAREGVNNYMLTVYADVQIVERNKGQTSRPVQGQGSDPEEGITLADAILPSIFQNSQISTQQDREFRFVKLFQIPLMTGSQWDWLTLSGVPQEEYAKFGECIVDPLASFVIKGKDKVFVTQDKQIPNIVRCLVKKGKSMAIIRSEALEKRSVNVVLKFITGSRDLKDVKICTIDLPFLLRGQKESKFNILNVFRFFIIWALWRRNLHRQRNSIEIMTGEFNNYLKDCCISPVTYRTIVSHLVDTLLEAKIVQDDDEFITAIAKRLGFPETLSFENVMTAIKTFFDEELFPHIVSEEYQLALDEEEWVPYPKFYALTNMLVKYTKCYVGLKPLDDRNHYGTKLLATVGIELGSLVEKGFRTVRNFLRKKLSDNGMANVDIPGILANKGEEEITKQIVTSFSTGNWKLKRGKARTGVVQQHDRTSILSQWAMVRKVAMPIRKDAKISIPRQVHPSSFNIIDPTNTPDSAQAGLMKQLAISVYITIDDRQSQQRAVDLASELREEGELGDDKGDDIPLYINNVWHGFGSPEVYQRYKEEKRSGRLGYFTEVFEKYEVDKLEETREYHILTSAGRAMWPAFVISNGDRFEALEQGFLNPASLTRNGATFTDMLRAGVVEYVSANEFEFGEFALDYEHFRAGLLPPSQRRFTHMNIDPVFQLSIEAATMPFPSNNPIPRVMYFGNMSRQPIGIPLSTFNIRQETDLKILNYSQKPLIASDMMSVVGLDQMGFGQNVTVFVMSLGGTDEDATVWAKEFLELGSFNTTLFETYSVNPIAIDREAQPEDDPNRFMAGVVNVKVRQADEIDVRELERIEPGTEQDNDNADPDENQAQNEEARTQEEEKDWPFGNRLPEIRGKRNVMVKPKDVLVRYKESIVAGAQSLEMKVTGKRTGFVHSTHRTKGVKGLEQKVVVRFPHFPGPGDKFANRFAQKGVIGAIRSKIDMPFTMDGRTPDVIFSPTSFTSRMTVGMFLEMLQGKAVISCNRNHFVNRLVTWKRGMAEPQIHNDFYILLDDILVLQNPADNRQQQFQTVTSIRKRLRGTVPEAELEARVSEVIRNEVHAGLWRRARGIPFKIRDITRAGKNIGKRVQYSIPNASFVTVLKTNEHAILYSQLDIRRKVRYFIEHQSELVPTYRIRGARDNKDVISRIKDATAFRPRNDDEVKQLMLEKGYLYTGKQIVFDGRTGKQSTAQIFTGPCYYMHLKHLVESKQQVRDQGNRSLLTRAPTGGKAKGGAVRKGEMTRSVALAHGASRFLKETFMVAADQYESIVCRKCGQFCYLDVEAVRAICETCGEDIDPFKVTMPFATSKIMRAMGASGGSVAVQVRPKPNFDIEVDDEEIELDPPEVQEGRPRSSRGNRTVTKIII